MRKEFVADVSHELKTPITSIMGYADTLLETDHDKEIETKFLGVISSEAKRMSKLVTDLLSLSRFDSNKTNIVKEEFDLGELAKKCQEKLQIEIDKKHLQVHCLVTANVPPVYAEKDGIERVIINILSNSIKYTNENGTINIYVGFVYNDAYIKFIDTGIGIPEEDLERIFERFYRVDKARTREMGGTGLGLSIAKEILDRNNGTIDIKSKLNEGTEVVIRIPTKTNNKFILKEEENLNEGEARRQPNIQEQKIIKEIGGWIICIVIAVILALLIKYFILTPTVVKQESMYPTLEENQRLILNRLGRTFKQMPKRGDIITFEAPTVTYRTEEDTDISNPVAIYEDEERNIFGNFSYNVLEIGKTSYIKRVIGLPGDHVQIKNGKVYINEEELEEDYLQPGIITDDAEGIFYDIIVPENTVFAMGDNRNSSVDCRAFGCIPLEKIEGKVLIRFWPLNELEK